MFHVAGCYFLSVERLLEGSSYSYVINIHKVGSKLVSWGVGTHSNRAQMTRGCSNHSYKLSLKLRFQYVFCMKQITNCKGCWFYLVYSLLLILLLFLCANWEGGGLDLRPYRGRKVCLSHLPHVSLQAY